tara:strand:- start:12448 stop:12678 length:231 start_codon:yes stop_codon:yes gene_type:complete
MPKYSGINRDYSGTKADPKSTQEEREKMMKEFLAKGGKVEKCPPGMAKLGVGSMDRSGKPRYTEQELKSSWDQKSD